MAGVHAAAIKFPPPLIYAIALALGLTATYFVRTPWIDLPGYKGAGLAFIVLGIWLAMRAFRAIRQADTTIMPGQPSTRLVTAGPFQVTRNPIYVAMASVYLGIAILFHSLWAMLLLPCAMYMLYRTAIHPEELYLEGLFGDDYRGYKRATRRWI